MARKCYAESLKIASLDEQCLNDLTTVARASHEEITDLDPRSDVHDERPSPVDELGDLQIGKLPGQTTKISRQLTLKLRQQLEAEILKNADLFAWSSTDMPGIDAEFMCHRLAIHKEAKPIAQMKRKVGGERREAIVAKTQKLLHIGFIREVRYTTWLANVVLVKKNSWKWRVCVNYTDLNKACPKDSYPLPNIDRGNLISSFDEFTIKHVPREQNTRADLLSKLASTEPSSRKPCTHPAWTTRSSTSVDNEGLGWMTDIWDYLKEGVLHENKDEARKMWMRLAKFVIIRDELFKRGISSPLLKCLTPSQAAYVIKEIRQGICGMHSGAHSMATRVLRAGYYWPTLKSDCQNHIQKCKEFQQFGNEFEDFLRELGIKHLSTSVEHPQTNSQAEAANKVILRELKNILWAYHCTPQSTTQETPYKLTYGADAMILVEIGEASHRRQVFSGEQNAQELAADLDLVDELRDEAQIHEEACKLRASRRYNTRVKPRSFREGDLVWRLLGEARKDTSDGKLAPTWGGPFRVTEDLENGAYRLEELSGKPIPRTWNATHLKFYFS
uniref:Transposon Ty3-I Gag-Pol polyprotein n=1 Tax=Cajanus cajan TaxID=3821 RepID=A0A151QXL0_CAJCA|nr:Transposon Ty3-I Gag-Pol polyprotein [Cajanus cajan]